MKLAPALISLGLFASACSPALAESNPRSVSADPRIRTVIYQKDQVVSLLAMMGVSTMVVFRDDEQIATVTMGDTVAWQAVPDQSRHFLFVKPVEPNAVTNMNVVTNSGSGQRVYNFILHGAAPGDTRRAVIKLRFSYPDDDAGARLTAKAKEMAANPNMKAALADPSKLNYAYGYKGDPQNKPIEAFDDGTKTFFKFAASSEVPGIFAVKSDRSETLINYRREGDYIVVDKVNPQWTLRNGKVSTCVFNQRGATP
ncbi:P-type conjugative transfer protein VirB9 [Labrys sp. 22185]|uniref:P-type conjugative transfer protein VirB9 n=1 Tax=Labrys sp. 22185 TaxID=3453888 RepID=UPI003F871907